MQNLETRVAVLRLERHATLDQGERRAIAHALLARQPGAPRMLMVAQRPRMARRLSLGLLRLAPI